MLATDSQVFRVHKSVLSLHSSAFKDMFNLTFVAPGDVENRDTAGAALARQEFEGLPLVVLGRG